MTLTSTHTETMTRTETPDVTLWTATESCTITETLTASHTLTKSMTLTSSLTLTPSLTGSRTMTFTPTQIIAPVEVFNVIAWPNPVSDASPVTFHYELPTMDVKDVEIRIYTQAMRLVRVLERCPVQYGVNEVSWDKKSWGLDDLSNGLYYFLIIARQELKESRKIGKLIILR